MSAPFFARPIVSGELCSGDANVGTPLRTVAALFVDGAGAYSTLPSVDAWPEVRDARLYRGDAPVAIEQGASARSPRFLAVADIVAAVAAVYGVDTAAILGTCRSKSIVEARHTAVLVARRCTRLSLSELGMAFERDHTTIINGIRRAEQRCREDRWIAAAVAELLEQFGANEEERVQ